MKKILLMIAGAALSLHAANWQVIGPDRSTPAEKTAVEELTHYLAKTAPGKITVGVENNPVFRVGKTGGIEYPELAAEEWIIKSVPGGVVLYGGGPRGTLYAVYRFIEEYLGVRWWNPREEYIPLPREITLPALDRRGKPYFEYRDIYRTDWPSDEGRFAVRHRLNRDGDRPIGAAYGGGMTFGPPYFAHTFERYLPPEKYMADHPEYYALVNGRRDGSYASGQLCLSNPELLPVIVARLREFIADGEKNAREKGVEAPKFYELSQNDNIVSCQCENCRKEVAQYGESGQLIRFLNKVGEIIEPDHPELIITTLAYLQTEHPPKNVRLRHNVVVRLCDTLSNQAASFRQADNQQFVDRLKQWQPFTDRLYVWDYSINYPFMQSVLPYASEFIIADNLRTMAGYRVKGVFFEHEFPFAADMYDLEVYLEAKLLEDPECDWEALYREFLALYYGPGAGAVDFYRQALHSFPITRNELIKFGETPVKNYCTILPIARLAEVQRKFDEAATLTGSSSDYSRRLARARMGLDLLTLKGAGIYRRQWTTAGNKLENYPVDEDAVEARLRQTFAQAAVEHKASAEHFKFAGAAEKELKNWRKNANVVIRNAAPPKKFAKVRHIGFNAMDFNLIQSGGSYFQLQYDDETESGITAAITDLATGKHHSPPIVCGVYNTEQKRTVAAIEIPADKLTEPGYHWFSFKARLNSTCYFYFTRSWQLQLEFGNLEPGDYEVWCNIAYSVDRDQNTIKLERVILVRK